MPERTASRGASAKPARAAAPLWPARGSRTLIGMVHIGALPGTPRALSDTGRAFSRLISQAEAEAKVLVDAGFDAIIVENMHDAPYVNAPHLPEVVSAMTAVAGAVRDAVGPKLTLGVQVLSGGAREGVAIALCAELQFVRCENFVFAHVADEGLMATAEAGPLMRYRRQIGAEHVRVLCDLKKKHASHAVTGDLSLADAAEAAEFFGADGLIVTGSATGKPTSVADAAEVRRASGLPLLIGSGVSPETSEALLEHADALIVGSWVKRDGHWRNPVDPKRARAMVRCVKA